MTEPYPDIHDEPTFSRAVSYLCDADPILAGIVARHGPPPRWQRAPGFASLLYIILEQQVSLASARAVYRRLSVLAEPLTPENFLLLDDVQLQSAGFSRQKIIYGRILAEAVRSGQLDFTTLAQMSDEQARHTLMQLKGIGAWTSEIYLMEALGRPDVLPAGDLALVVATQEIYQLAARPVAPELAMLAERWRPWRSVAVHILWWHYLQRGRGNFAPPSDAYQPPGK